MNIKRRTSNNSKYFVEYRKRLRTYGTVSEAALWLHLKNRQLEGIKFRRQFGVGNYILDFYAPALSLGVELDGSVHNRLQENMHDYFRREYLKSKGIEELRFTNDDVCDRHEDVLRIIREKIKERLNTNSETIKQ